MATYSVLSGRVTRSPRPCDDRHSGSRKEMKVARRLWLAAVSVVMASVGSWMTVKSELQEIAFLSDEPPSLALTPVNVAVFAVLDASQMCMQRCCFITLQLFHDRCASAAVVRAARWRGEHDCHPWNTWPTGSSTCWHSTWFSCISSYCLDVNRYQKHVGALSTATFKAVLPVLHILPVFSKSAFLS